MKVPKLHGLNHISLSVSDIEKSIEFYHGLLGFQIDALWASGAYLSLSNLWLCLSLSDSPLNNENSHYTHIAFTVTSADFCVFMQQLKTKNVIEWQQNSSEGDSFYFLDPDSYKLELHVGDLTSRIYACKQKPYKSMKFYSNNKS